MNDWLSQLEEKRKSAEAAREAQALRDQFEKLKEIERKRLSYEQNKESIDAAYSAIERYAKRASNMGLGFRVKTEKYLEYGLCITGEYKVSGEDGELTMRRRLELTPWNNGLRVQYNGMGQQPTIKTNISLKRITEKVIANWVRWAVGEGPDDPIEDHWFRIIGWSSLAIVGGSVLALVLLIAVVLLLIVLLLVMALIYK